MRTFEAVLILLNFLTVFLAFKKRTRIFLLGVAGVNALALLVHGITEGFRYQVIFPYIFVILLAVYALVKTRDKFFEARTPRVLKAIVISLSLIFLSVTAFLAYALPVFSLPKPTGSYDVGVRYVRLTDEKRNDPFLDKSPEKRELMVKVYYPAKRDGTKPYSPYFHNSAQLIKLFTAGYGLPDFVFSHLNLVKTHSKDGLQLSDKEKNYPGILFSHGAGTSMEVQTASSEDLASNGYIVAAIDHTYVSGATVFPNKMVSAREATTDFKVAEPAEVITQIMADDCKFVMDSLYQMNEGKMDSFFKGKINVEKIGAIGHSVGGAAVYNLAVNDRRVKAAVNLDGRVFIAPGREGNMAPFLMLASDEYAGALEKQECLMGKLEDMDDEEQKNMLLMYGSKEAYHEAYQKELQNTEGLIDVPRASGNLFTIQGSSHMKFTDIGLFIGVGSLRKLINIGGKTDPARCLEITDSVAEAFFDVHLKGRGKNSLESQVEKFSELKQVDLK